MKIEAYIKLGQSEKAHETLVNALNVAYPGQWIKPFAEMNYGALDLLYRVRESHGQEEKYSVFLNKIIDAIAGEKPDKGSNSKILEDKKNADVISLTQSELKVLKLVAKGYRNKEIADSLYNSEETIKKHIYNMFQKLDVKNRLNLVNRAKELGIIES